MVALEICLVLEFVLILLRVTQSAGLKRIVAAITLFVFSFLVMTMLLNDHQYSMGKLDHSPIFPKLPAVLVFVWGYRGGIVSDLENSQRAQTRECYVVIMVGFTRPWIMSHVVYALQITFGRIIFCNSKMREVSQMMTGMQLQDYEILHQAIHSENSRPGIVTISLDNSVFYFPNGKVWMFQEYYLQGKELENYKQAVAIDVSEIYYNSEEIKANNESLKMFNRKLEEMYEKIDDKIREQETLAMKMQVHDNFGRSLFMIRRILENKENTSCMNKQLDVLKEQVYILTNMIVENMEDLYQNTEKQAREMGIIIHMKGKVPENSNYRILIDRAVRECVTNCARHAQGSEVNVIIEDDSGEYTVRITNNGDIPDKNAKEGGGLSALRRALEIENCSMITVFDLYFACF